MVTPATTGGNIVWSNNHPLQQLMTPVIQTTAAVQQQRQQQLHHQPSSQPNHKLPQLDGVDETTLETTDKAVDKPQEDDQDFPSTTDVSIAFHYEVIFVSLLVGYPFQKMIS